MDGPVKPRHALAGRASNNPAGRLRGSGEVGKLRAQLALQIPQVVSKVLEAALAGDLQAAKILLDRVFPTLKAEAVPVLIPGLSGSLTQQAHTILRHAADAAIPADTAAELIRAVGSLVTIEQGDELRRRLEVLELKDFA